MLGGLMACYSQVLSLSRYAMDMGYIPVVDFKHYYNMLFKDGKEFVDNSWEYFFEQPCGVGLEALKKDCKIVFSPAEWDIAKTLPKKHPHYLSGGENLESFNFIKFNKETQQFLQESYETLIKSQVGEDNEILGILCRGTDYTKTRPAKHYIQPEPQQVIDKAKELLEKYHYKKIWLATEDAEIYKLFKQEFKDMLIDNPSFMYSDFQAGTYIGDNKAKRKDHFYNLSKDYLRSLYILSKCKYLIAGHTTAVTGLWVMSEAFKNQKYAYFWDLGNYKEIKKIGYRNITEKLFSAKNEYYEDTKRKIFTILGVRIKLKKRKFKLSGGIEIIDGKVVNKK